MSSEHPVTGLVARAKAGDKQAWDALVERYAPLIWSIAWLGIPVGSIGPSRRRCLDKLRRHPAIAALISAEADTARGEIPDPVLARGTPAMGGASAGLNRRPVPHRPLPRGGVLRLVEWPPPGF